MDTYPGPGWPIAFSMCAVLIIINLVSIAIEHLRNVRMKERSEVKVKSTDRLAWLIPGVIFGCIALALAVHCLK